MKQKTPHKDHFQYKRLTAHIFYLVLIIESVILKHDLSRSKALSQFDSYAPKVLYDACNGDNLQSEEIP